MDTTLFCDDAYLPGGPPYIQMLFQTEKGFQMDSGYPAQPHSAPEPSPLLRRRYKGANQKQTFKPVSREMRKSNTTTFTAAHKGPLFCLQNIFSLPTLSLIQIHKDTLIT